MHKCSTVMCDLVDMYVFTLLVRLPLHRYEQAQYSCYRGCSHANEPFRAAAHAPIYAEAQACADRER